MDVSKVFMVHSAKGYDMLCVDNYLYHYDRCTKRRFSWVCNKRRSRQTPCKARLITTHKEEDLSKHTVRKVYLVHTHERCPPMEIEKAKQRKRIADMEGKPSTLGNKVLKRKYHATNDESPENKYRLLDGVMLDFENKQKIYQLLAHDQRQMVAHNGFLYRLDGKSPKNPIFRWQCIRHRDMQCKTVIFTKCPSNDMHQLMPTRQDPHNHEAYTPAKLRKLCTRHSIKVENSDVSMRIGQPTNTDKIDIKKEPLDEVEFISTKKLNDPLHSNASDSKGTSTKKPVQLDKLKFEFLPTKSKASQVLCIEDYIYNLDTKNPQNEHSYWSCCMRRDKDLKCNARAIMKTGKAGAAIVALSGEHKHPIFNLKKQDKPAEQKARVVTSAASKSDLKPLNENCKQKSYEKIKSFTVCQSDISLSSISDALDTDDEEFDFFNGNLPTNISAMRKKCVKQVEPVEPVVESKQDQDELMVEEYLETQDTDWLQIEQHFLNEQDELIFDDNADEQSSVSSTDLFKVSPSRKITTDTSIDISKVSKLRSAMGGEQLCVDGYIYQVKSICGLRTYWACIKSRDAILKCKARLTTVIDKDKIKVVRATNPHSHRIIEDDIKRRLYNEIAAHGVAQGKPTKNLILEKSLDEVSKEYTALLGHSFDKRQQSKDEGKTMKLYSVSDGPPSVAVRLTLAALKLPHELINVDFIAAEHMTEEYAKMNPQKEIPVLDDDGFYLSESIAIMQYLCDKYAPDSELYPKNAVERAVVNQRLCFNMGFYYASIAAHSMLPIFFDFERTEMSLKKTKNALSVFETYLQRAGTKYAAADHLTIADFALVSATLCLESIDFDLSPYPLVAKWYATFKAEYPDLWNVAKPAMEEIQNFEKNHPDLSHMNHPFLPTRKPKA